MPARILVVDDAPLNVKLLTVKLEYEHYVVSTAANGLEALAKIEAEKPDIVLLDVLMPPGIDGFETCRRIRADPATAHIPVVMLTALQDVDDLVRGLEAGADDFLTWPINDIALMARIRSQLRQKRYYESLLEQSMIDPLTGAFNCRYLEAHAPRLIARCRTAHKPIAVLMIDVDHFKQINDEHGHAAGNQVLKQIVNRITSALRPSDLVARMGGEEFVVVMPETDLDAGHRIAERLRSGIAGTPVEEVAVTVSIGAAVIQPDTGEEELDAALRRADEAPYEAKRAGRNRVNLRSVIGGAARTPRSSRSPIRWWRR